MKPNAVLYSLPFLLLCACHTEIPVPAHLPFPDTYSCENRLRLEVFRPESKLIVLRRKDDKQQAALRRTHIGKSDRYVAAKGWNNRQTEWLPDPKRQLDATLRYFDEEGKQVETSCSITIDIS